MGVKRIYTGFLEAVHFFLQNLQGTQYRDQLEMVAHGVQIKITKVLGNHVKHMEFIIEFPIENTSCDPRHCATAFKWTS